MRSYESMFITPPSLAPEAYDRLLGSFEEIITNGGGAVSNTVKWGRRSLAYEVQKFKDGIYTIFEYDGPNDLVKELERRFKLNDSVLKFMTVKTERKAKLENKGKAARQAKQEAKAKRRGSKSEDRRDDRRRSDERREG